MTTSLKESATELFLILQNGFSAVQGWRSECSPSHHCSSAVKQREVPRALQRAIRLLSRNAEHGAPI